eukprot:1979393-Rhodomonas_salina.2
MLTAHNDETREHDSTTPQHNTHDTDNTTIAKPPPAHAQLGRAPDNRERHGHGLDVVLVAVEVRNGLLSYQDRTPEWCRHRDDHVRPLLDPLLVPRPRDKVFLLPEVHVRQPSVLSVSFFVCEPLSVRLCVSVSVCCPPWREPLAVVVLLVHY